MIDLPVYDASNWQNDAQCASELVDPNTMAPETASRADIKDATQVCFRCPVKDQCEDAAEAQGDAYGIWGGRWWGESPGSPAVVACQWCRAEVANAGTGRVREFCGPSCRQAARRARLAVVAVPA